jgi:hypothetical protein
MNNETARPGTYLGASHPLIPFDRTCRACSAGDKREYYNGQKEENQPKEFAVGGAGPDDLSKVKLIVISDFTGPYEATTGYPFVSNREGQDERQKNGLLRSNNAGGFLRMALEMMFGLDSYHDVWCTNAMKCNPGKNKPLFNTQVKKCAQLWLQNELLVLDDYVPTIPILVAGGTAFETVCLLYPEEGKYLASQKLNNCRRRTDLTLGQHPAVFTLNPSRPARCEPKMETGYKLKKGRVHITNNDWLYPPLPGSPLYSYLRDLRCLKPFLPPAS